MTQNDHSDVYIIPPNFVRDLLIGMFVALDYVWSRTKEDRTREKAIFIDEAWKLLSSNELAADYIQEIYKTIRAYGGAAISQ